MNEKEFPQAGLFLDENNCLIEFTTHFGQLIRRRLGAHKQNRHIKCYFNVGSKQEDIFMRFKDQMSPLDIFLHRPHDKQQCFFLLDQYVLIGRDTKGDKSYISFENAELIDSVSGKSIPVSFGVWHYTSAECRDGVLFVRQKGFGRDHHYFTVKDGQVVEIDRAEAEEIVKAHRAQVPEGWQVLKNLPEKDRLL